MANTKRKIAEIEKSEKLYKSLFAVAGVAVIAACIFCGVLYFNMKEEITKERERGDALYVISDWHDYVMWDFIAEEACKGKTFAATCKADIIKNQRGFHFTDDYLEEELKDHKYTDIMKTVRHLYGDGD